MRHRLLLLGILIPALGYAQFPAIAPGTRVRVEAPTVARKRVTGTVRSLANDTLVLTVQLPRVYGRGTEFADRPLPVSAIRGVFESLGTSSWAVARRGFVVGAWVGLFVAATEAVVFTGGGEDGRPADFAGLVLVLVIINEMVWPPLLALVGAFAGVEIWRPVYSSTAP